MKQLTWEEYYDGFYDWVPSTQKSYAYRLSDYGSADEVWEIAEELDFVDSAFAAKFLEKAFSAGVRFTPEQVLEMVAMVDQSLLSKMAEQTTVPFNREQLEEIYLMIDDFSFRYGFTAADHISVGGIRSDECCDFLRCACGNTGNIFSL